MNSIDGPSRKYGGLSQEERLADRQDRLREAALDLVHDKGVTELTIGAVCARATLAKRYFYETYTSLEELLSAAMQDVFDSISQAIDAAGNLGISDPRQVLTLAIEAVLDAMDDPRTARLYLESAASPALLATRDAAVDRYVNQLLGLMSSTSVDDVDAQLVGHLLVSGSTHVVAMWLRGALPIERNEFIERLLNLATTAVAGLGPAERQ
ncbi:hypothetical protein ASG84_07820 [Rhodococcus sp. Leaf278]|uniref:TetR/AcrR family transcriptional regulator n=1 Tax=Rhodococcus sp. Leaf278 TaxID=1736319 RepID=UPI000708E217|nr:TetR/AcrR family transcriptional regulator [Rhodococcus sp. Leaf278]KQU47039.1 hypothetical protein ASG84_07820 [Rhodococcus sp. Leaf278]